MVDRSLRTSEVAEALGLKATTVQRYARNGAIPSDKTPGGQHRFDLQEVREALDVRERNQAGAIIPPQRSGSRGWLVGSFELDVWAGQLIAQSEFPWLMNQLIAGSVVDLQRLQIRVDEGINLPGWDGIVQSRSGNAWVPGGGMSAWEFGVGQDPQLKAEADYQERLNDSLGMVQSDTVFVFATPHLWPGCEAWATAKRATGVWRDVLAFDANALAGWLEATPPVHVQTTKLLGRDPDGAAGIEDHWNSWSARTSPRLPPELLTCSRDAGVLAVGNWSSGPPAAITVVADSQDEATAFLVASLLSTSETERLALTSRALVVHTRQAWDELLARSTPSRHMLLIPTFLDPPSNDAVTRGHWVAVPVNREVVVQGQGVDLPRLRLDPVRQVLLSAGVAKHKVDELASLACRSIPMLRRRLSVDATLRTPAWAREPAQINAAIPVLLAGSWRDDVAGDREFLEKLAGQPYHALEASWATAFDSGDPYVVARGHARFCVSQVDAWALLRRRIPGDVFANFLAAAVEVLTELDPAFTLEADKRWAAQIFGKTRRWSPALRSAIAATAAMIATGGDEPLAGGEPPQRLADQLVYAALHKANVSQSDNEWSSLGDVLPALAEAAPDVFLRQIDEGFDSGTLSTVFDAQAERAPFGSPPQTGLLWALEVLTCSRDHVVGAAIALARLAELDKVEHSNWLNRPINSLVALFIGTGADVATLRDDWLSVLDAVRRVSPDIGFQLTKSCVSTRGVMTSPSRPRWREWSDDPADEDVTYLPSRHLDAILERLLADTETDATRWPALAELLDGFPRVQQLKLLQAIRTLSADTHEAEIANAMAQALHDLVDKHRRAKDAFWALPEELLTWIESEAIRLGRENISTDQVRLFAAAPRLPTRVPFEERMTELSRLRQAVVTELFDQGGLQAISELAARVDQPAAVGHALADAADGLDVAMIDQLDTEAGPGSELARGYVGRRMYTEGAPWTERQLSASATWSSPRVAAFLLAGQIDDATLDRLDRLDTEINAHFWRNVRPWALPRGAAGLRAASALIDHSRAAAALDLLADARRNGVQIDPELTYTALTAANPQPGTDDLVGFPHDVADLLSHLDESGFDEARLASVEWRYLPIADHLPRKPAALSRQLARDPNFFVDVVAATYRSEHDPETLELDQDDVARARVANALLKGWRDVPGSLAAPSGPALAEWVATARGALYERGLLRPGDICIGRMLRYAGSPKPGDWPTAEVCELIETVRSRQLEEGLEIEVYNSNGANWRNASAGGAPERELAEQYSKRARDLGARYPRTVAMLRRISEQFEADARRQDETTLLHEETLFS
jgi:excisionase family DNA binding protein